MKRLLRGLIDDDGATAVEYGVMLGLILLALLSSVALVGGKSNGMWSGIQSTLTSSNALHSSGS
jgi:pilus assembly protein Flp/PilA